MAEIRLEDWQWWDAERDDVARVVCESFLDIIREGAVEDRNRLAAMRSMYLDQADERFEGGNFTRELRSPYNLLQGAVDATVAQIVTQRPRPMVVSIGGNGKLRRLARKRQRWVDGEYRRLKVYKHARKLVLDSLLYGAGILKITTANGRNKLERVWRGDLWTDPREERFDCVRTLYQLYAIDREVLRKRYPKYDKEIRNVRETVIDDVPFPDLRTEGYQSPNLINVIEAWRLPVADGVSGRRVLVIDGATLEDEEWDDDFPFIFYHWADKGMGFWGQGMVERGAGMQSDLNELCGIVREAYELFVTQVWAKKGSTDVTSLDNRVGKVNTYTGDRPPDIVSPSINPVILQQEERMAGRFNNVLGVNPMHAQASRPKNIESAKGLQVLSDETTVRFVPNEQLYEEVLAESLYFQLIRNARRIMKKGGSKQRVYGGQYMRGGAQAVDFLDTVPEDGMDEDEVFFVAPFPVANLSNSVSQRYDDIERMEQNGAFPDPRMKRELMAVPDVDGYVDLDLAGSDLVELAIERALDGENVSPDSYWPFMEASVRIGQAIQLALLDGEDNAGIERLRNLHQALLRMPVNPNNGLTTTPGDPSLAPTMPVMNPSPTTPVGPMAPPPIPGGVPPGPQGPMQ
jgi:hypothetical protein